MGSLKLPSGRRVYIDAQSVIYTTEPHPTYFGVLRPVWAAVAAGTIELVTSEMTVLEAMTGPYKSGDTRVEADYEQLFTSGVLTLVPIGLDILRAAARLRASVPRLRAPDAIHAATGQAAGCALFVTNDFAFRGVPGLNVAVLRDVLAAP